MYTSCFLLSKYLMWILLKALIACLFENIVGRAKFYITMYAWMRHFKSVKFYKIYGLSCLCISLRKLLLNFTHDVLRKVIMSTLQNCVEMLSWELTIRLLMMFYDLLWVIFTCQDIEISWYQHICFARLF